jgi:hypothetical protein
MRSVECVKVSEFDAGCDDSVNLSTPAYHHSLIGVHIIGVLAGGEEIQSAHWVRPDSADVQRS